MEALDHRGKHGRRIEVTEVERMAGLRRQDSQEDILCAAISFAEGVNRVELRQEMRRRCGECRSAEPAQEMVGTELPEKSGQFSPDMLRVAEAVAALGDPDAAASPCPWIDILEQVVMDGEVVAEAETACGHPFAGALQIHLQLVCIQGVLVPEAEQVPQNLGPGIAIGIRL